MCVRVWGLECAACGDADAASWESGGAGEGMDVKYRPAVLFSNSGAAPAAAAAKKVRPTEGEGVESVYRECLKNHAASLGGHAMDGCGEFMPSPAANPSNPASLKCAACGCHRNFHRRLSEAPPSPPLLAPPPFYLVRGVHPQRGEETPEDRLPVAGGDDDDTEDSSNASDYEDNRPASPLPAPAVMPPGPRYLSSATQMLLSLSTSAPASVPAVMASRPPGPGPGAPTARKRFRTSFSPEQKQQMQALSERLGWRLQKNNVALVDECCREIGIDKGVFKVWMHNNKHTFLGCHSARRTTSVGAPPCHPSAYPTPPLLQVSAFTPAVHADFNITNGSSTPTAADHSSILQPATVSGSSGSPQSS